MKAQDLLRKKLHVGIIKKKETFRNYEIKCVFRNELKLTYNYYI